MNNNGVDIFPVEFNFHCNQKSDAVGRKKLKKILFILDSQS